MADGSLGIWIFWPERCLPRDELHQQRAIIHQLSHCDASCGRQTYHPAMRNDTYDLDAIAAAINEETRVVILANPNNPTGTMFDGDATDKFSFACRRAVLVVLDEAYSDFATYFAAERGITYSRSMDYVREGRKNVIVLRTFSKAHGLAGVRLGYACGDPELLRYLAGCEILFLFPWLRRRRVWPQSATKTISARQWKTTPRARNGCWSD